MSPWKSRWSCVTLVSAAAAKRQPSTRPSARPCEETSIETASTPRLRIARSVRWRSRLSGVVFTARWRSSAYRTSIVPISPTLRPASRRIDSTRKLVLVLPFVPVTPTSSSSSAGWPKNAVASGASARRASATTTAATPAGSGGGAASRTSATAPSESACAR